MKLDLGGRKSVYFCFSNFSNPAINQELSLFLPCQNSPPSPLLYSEGTKESSAIIFSFTRSSLCLPFLQQQQIITFHTKCRPSKYVFVGFSSERSQESFEGPRSYLITDLQARERKSLFPREKVRRRRGELLRGTEWHYLPRQVVSCTERERERRKREREQRRERERERKERERERAPVTRFMS